MKEIRIEKKQIKEIRLPIGRFESDWFACSKCGYETRMLVRSDVASCPECGGRMYRK